MDMKLLCDIAIKAALAAGNIILNQLENDIEVNIKNKETNYSPQVVTAVDLACEKAILEILEPSLLDHDIAILSEEKEDDGGRFDKAFFWCVDPMDGTLAFINKYPGFSVSISLIARDGTPHIGVVYDPSTDTLYYAIKGKGAYKNNQAWIINQAKDYLSYYTDKRLADTPQKEKITQQLEKIIKEKKLKDIKEFAGAGAVLNALFVLENRPACMIKLPKKQLGGGSIWDYAATACIYNELGLTAVDYLGNELELNKRDGSFMNKQGVYFANF